MKNVYIKCLENRLIFRLQFLIFYIISTVMYYVTYVLLCTIM